MGDKKVHKAQGLDTGDDDEDMNTDCTNDDDNNMCRAQVMTGKWTICTGDNDEWREPWMDPQLYDTYDAGHAHAQVQVWKIKQT